MSGPLGPQGYVLLDSKKTSWLGPKQFEDAHIMLIKQFEDANIMTMGQSNKILGSNSTCFQFMCAFSYTNKPSSTAVEMLIPTQLICKPQLNSKFATNLHL